MTVSEFLKKDNIDVTTNKSSLGNQLKADLASQKVQIDFEKELEELTEEEKYQIGRSLILFHVKEKPFFKNELISIMDDFIKTDCKRQNNNLKTKTDIS